MTHLPPVLEIIVLRTQLHAHARRVGELEADLEAVLQQVDPLWKVVAAIDEHAMAEVEDMTPGGFTDVQSEAASVRAHVAELELALLTYARGTRCRDVKCQLAPLRN